MLKNKHWLLALMMILLITTVIGPTPTLEANDDATSSPIKVYTNKWGIVPEQNESMEIDGQLTETVWDEAFELTGEFLTAYYNKPDQDDPTVKLFYDEENLYVGVEYASEDGVESLANIDLLVSTTSAGDDFYRIPVKVKNLTVPYVNEWGSNIEVASNVNTSVHKELDRITAEVVIPFDSLGVQTVSPGDEWRFNAIIQHEMGSKPLASWVPFRRSTNWYNGGSGARIEADITNEGRLGSIFMGEIPNDITAGGEINLWDPDSLNLMYKGFTEKELSFNLDDLNPSLEDTTIGWKKPNGHWESVEDYTINNDSGTVTIHFNHPNPSENGLYQMQLIIHNDDNNEANLSILSFDRHSLVEAGNALYSIPQTADGERIEVSAAPPSEEVQELLALIPEKTGFRFTGQPDDPALHPDNLYDWSPNDPHKLIAKNTKLEYPNDTYPENQTIAVKNKNGEIVEYPYYEDESGKRYFLSAHMWHKQRDYVAGKLIGIANNDPLGAARLLYRFAEVFDGWVPTNEYPWLNQPLDYASGPPYTYWGGLWSRWSTSDLGGNFRHVADTYSILKKTNAFELLSDEVGVDVEHKIVNEMLKPSIDYYRSFPIHYNNMEYHNALGLISLGKALDDPSYIHETIEWAEDFMMNTFLFDGFFQETTISYHAQSTDGINTVLSALTGWSDPANYVSPRSGTTLQQLDMRQKYPVLKNAVEIPNTLVYPNGKYFPTHDTWASTTSGNPKLDAGSFLLPASGIARLARGIPAGTNTENGITYDFPTLDIVEQSVAHVNIGVTLQLEANEANQSITFRFDVPKTDTYQIDLKPFKAASYGHYEILIDGEKLTDFNFYNIAGGARDFEPLGETELTAGTHTITFQNIGKNEESTNYKLGIIQLALLDEEAQNKREEIVQEEEENPTQLYLTFQPRYGHHHLDSLNLTLYAYDQELLPDIGYTHTFYSAWTRSALGHNTVVVDSSDMTTAGQARHGGNIEVFAPIESDVQVTRASQESAYTQTDEYSREPWLIRFPDAENNEGYVLDLFRVSGGNRHEYTLNGDANHDAAFETDLSLTDYGPYLLPEGVEVREPETEIDRGDAQGHYYGYISVKDVKKADVEDGRYDLNLVTEKDGEEMANMKIIGLVEPGQNELFLGESPSVRATRLYGTSMDNNNEAVKYTMPKMVLRREGTDLTSNFITAMEPYASGGEARIHDIERLVPDQAVEGDIAVKVSHGNTIDIILSSLDPEQPLVVGDMTLIGKMGMIRLQDGEIQSMRLIGGTLLQKGDTVIMDEEVVTGEITGVYRQSAGDAHNAFLTSASVPSEMIGNHLVITHPDGKTHGYLIDDLQEEDEQTLIIIKDMDPGFTINNDGTSVMKFYPFTEWTGTHTFRIENYVKSEAMALEFLQFSELDSVITVGSTQQLTVTAMYSDESTEDVTDQAVYTSSDESVASVSANGVVHAHKQGEVVITAEYGGQIITETIQVTPRAQENIQYIADQLQHWIESGDITKPLTNQLENAVRQADHHFSKSRMQQAIKSLNDVLKHINNEAHADKISIEVKEELIELVERIRDSLIEQLV